MFFVFINYVEFFNCRFTLKLFTSIYNLLHYSMFLNRFFPRFNPTTTVGFQKNCTRIYVSSFTGLDLKLVSKPVVSDLVLVRNTHV